MFGELLFNRQIRGQLPQLQMKKLVDKHREAKKNIERRKEENKVYYDQKKKAKYSDIKVGDTVICLQKIFNKLTPRFSPEMLVVIERAGSKVMAESQDKRITWNISHFKKIVVSDSEDDWEPYLQAQPQELRRSVRKRAPVDRYGQLIPSDSTCASCGGKGHFAESVVLHKNMTRTNSRKKTQKFTCKVRPETDKSKPYKPKG